MTPKIEKLAKDLLLSIKTIEKWIGVRFEGKLEMGYSDCAFCRTLKCKECPVHKAGKKGDDGCLGTPYTVWWKHHLNQHNDRVFSKCYCPTCKRLAQDELMFLIGIAHGLADELEKELNALQIQNKRPPL